MIISFIVGTVLGIISSSTGKLVYRIIDVTGLAVVLLLVFFFIPLPVLSSPLPVDQVTPPVFVFLYAFNVVQPFVFGDAAGTVLHVLWSLNNKHG